MTHFILYIKRKKNNKLLIKNLRLWYAETIDIELVSYYYALPDASGRPPSPALHHTKTTIQLQQLATTVNVTL